MNKPPRDFHTNLPEGTILRATWGGRIRIREAMRGDWTHVEHVRKDDKPDRRCMPFSGSLLKSDWTIEALPDEPEST